MKNALFRKRDKMINKRPKRRLKKWSKKAMSNRRSKNKKMSRKKALNRSLIKMS